MPLVDYDSSPSSSCSSSSSAAGGSNRRSKRRRLSGAAADRGRHLPSLPASFYDLYTVAPRASASDDPSLHHGRTRAVPHKDGNWAAHVYLEWYPDAEAVGVFARLLESITSTEPAPQPADSAHLHPAYLSALTGAPAPLHVSLSAPHTLPSLQHAQSFLYKTRTALARCLSVVSHGAEPSLVLQPRSLVWVSNRQGTRRFLAVTVAPVADPAVEDAARIGDGGGRVKENNESNTNNDDDDDDDDEAGGSLLAAVLGAANDVARDCDLEELYSHSSSPIAHCHVSLAWKLPGDRAGNDLWSATETGSEQSVTEVTDKAVPGLASSMAEVRRMRMVFKEVKIKVGREITNVNFGQSPKGKSSGGVLG